MAKLTRLQQQIASQRRKDEKAAKHAAMMAERAAQIAADAAKREALNADIAIWAIAYEGWRSSGEIGPRPVHPQDVGTGSDWNAYEYDMARIDMPVGIQYADDTDDLIAAAAELGIDIAA